MGRPAPQRPRGPECHVPAYVLAGIPPDVLTHLATDPTDWVRISVAGNPATPITALEQMAATVMPNNDGSRADLARSSGRTRRRHRSRTPVRWDRPSATSGDRGATRRRRPVASTSAPGARDQRGETTRARRTTNCYSKPDEQQPAEAGMPGRSSHSERGVRGCMGCGAGVEAVPRPRTELLSSRTELPR